ncbi:MAG: hypothetical protein JJ916_01840 [Phycisphaerales bacterium]|nr:hypothetical protein [Phycisphaerales bacterium]
MKASELAHPACPTCHYDLAGIIRKDGTATCPECVYVGLATTRAAQRMKKREHVNHEIGMLLKTPIFLLIPIAMFVFAALVSCVAIMLFFVAP